jgi:hypothetical protein
MVGVASVSALNAPTSAMSALPAAEAFTRSSARTPTSLAVGRDRSMRWSAVAAFRRSAVRLRLYRHAVWYAMCGWCPWPMNSQSFRSVGRAGFGR